MQSVEIHTWKPRRAKRRVALPIVALVNSALVVTAAASSAFLYYRFTQQPIAQPQVAVQAAPEPAKPLIEPAAVVAPAPKSTVEPIEVELPPIEPVDISKPRSQAEPPPLEAKIEPAMIVAVDLSSGRQIVDLPGEGGSLRIDRIEGLPGISAPSHENLSRDVEIQVFADRSVYLSLSSHGSKLKIETFSTLPQFRNPVSAARAADVRDEATKRHATASQTKAALMAQIADIDAWLKDGTAKKLTVYNQGEARKAILRTQLEVAEIAVEQAKTDLESANRVYQAITETLPKMRLIVAKN